MNCSFFSPVIGLKIIFFFIYRKDNFQGQVADGMEVGFTSGYGITFEIRIYNEVQCPWVLRQ